MSLLRWPRLWVLLTSAALVIAGLWLLVVPVTVVYTTSSSDSTPREVATIHSWWTNDQELMYTDATGVDLSRLSLISMDQTRLIDAFRLDCGNLFASGPNEKMQAPVGPAMCASVETPRRVIALSLLALGVAAVLVAVKLSDRAESKRDRYRQPYSQRRMLKRGR